MTEPITMGLIATGLTVLLTTTQIGETVYSWFAPEKEECYTKVNDEPEQWKYLPCEDTNSE